MGLRRPPVKRICERGRRSSRVCVARSSLLDPLRGRSAMLRALDTALAREQKESRVSQQERTKQRRPQLRRSVFGSRPRRLVARNVRLLGKECGGRRTVFVRKKEPGITPGFRLIPVFCNERAKVRHETFQVLSCTHRGSDYRDRLFFLSKSSF